MEDKFTNIYDKCKWGKKNGKGMSGTGSNNSPDTRFYINLLINHIQENNIKTICDMGCGDWEFSKTIDWEGLHYTGIDCVKSVIDFNKENYSSENIQFIHGEAGDIPEGYDLVILKDVIQHWEDKQVKEILPQIIEKNKFVLIGNGYKFGRTPSKNNWTERTLDKNYHYHPIDINKKPLNEIQFNLLNTTCRRCKQFNLIKNST